jgi:hypothetical protein
MATAIDNAAGWVTSRYNDWDDRRTTMEDNWDKWKRIWRVQATTEDKTYDTEKSTIKTPATKVVVDTAIANLISVLFSREPFFDIDGQQLVDDKPGKTLQAYIDYLFRKQKYKSKMNNYVTDLVTLGTAVGVIDVTQDVRQTIFAEGAIEGVNFSADIVAVDKRVITPEFRHVPLADFFIEPSALDVQSAEGCIIRTHPRIPALKKLERMGVIKGVDRIDKKDANQQGGGKIDDDRQQELTQTGVSADGAPDSVEVLTYWGWMDEETLNSAGYKGEIEDGGAEVYCIVSGSTVLKLDPNPHISKRRPIVKDVFQPVPNLFYGMGAIEVAQTTQDTLDAIVRQRLDNIAVAINNIWGIDKNNMVSGQDLSVHPNKIFLTEGSPRDVIEQFSVSDVTQSTFTDTQQLERWIQEAVGLPKTAGGVPFAKEQSATEVSILENAANQKILNVVNRIEQNTLSDTLRWYYQIIMQFLDTEEIVKVTSPQDGQTLEASVTPESISGDYDFIPMGSVMIERQAELGKIFAFLDRTANPVDMAITNRASLIKKVYEILLGDKDSDLIVRSLTTDQIIQIASQLPNTGSAPALDEPTQEVNLGG